jgi:hypothetical protein
MVESVVDPLHKIETDCETLKEQEGNWKSAIEVL